MLSSVIVGYTAVLISIVVGSADHEDLGDSKSIASRSWIDN